MIVKVMSREFWFSRILERLSEPRTLAGLAKEVGLTRQTLSKHLKAMEMKGLVSRSYEKPERGRPRTLFIAVKEGRVAKRPPLEPLRRDDLILVRFGAFRKLCSLNRREICTKTGKGCRLRNCPLATRE